MNAIYKKFELSSPTNIRFMLNYTPELRQKLLRGVAKKIMTVGPGTSKHELISAHQLLIEIIAARLGVELEEIEPTSDTGVTVLMMKYPKRLHEGLKAIVEERKAANHPNASVVRLVKELIEVSDLTTLVSRVVRSPLVPEDEPVVGFNFMMSMQLRRKIYDEIARRVLAGGTRQHGADEILIELFACTLDLPLPEAQEETFTPGKKIGLVVTLPEDMHEKLKGYCAAHQVSQNGAVIQFIEEAAQEGGW